MGSINNGNKKFVEMQITLEDLFNADKHAYRFTIASFGVHILRCAAPHIADKVRKDTNTLTDYFFKDGNMIICLGKEGYSHEEVEAAIEKYKKENQ